MPSKQVEFACSYGASLWPNAISVWPSFHPFVFSPFHLFHSSCSSSFSFRFLRIFIAMILRSAFTTNWCMCPVTTSTRMVLNMVAIAMGRSSFWMTSRQSMMATPGGTKLFYPLQLNDLGFKKEREQQHSDDARWQFDACCPNNDLAKCKASKDNKKLFSHLKPNKQGELRFMKNIYCSLVCLQQGRPDP